MRRLPALACLLIASSFARAQLAVPRVPVESGIFSVSAAPAFSAAASAPMPALASPSFAAAPALLSPVPALAPALAALSPAGERTFSAAASGPEKAASPSSERSAAALSEFSRLVKELMGDDKKRSEAAAAELFKIKNAHLNAKPEQEKAKTLDFKPMQMPVGMHEAKKKRDELNETKDLKELLRKKSIPYIEDYKGRKRPVDHHHEDWAAWKADIEEIYAHRYFDRELHGLIKGLERAEFYAVTKAMGLFYDRDEHGAGPIDPKDLPKDIRGMVDDPFRSLAGSVRDAGGYDKTALPFAEFQWANYFRSRLKTSPKDDFDKAVAEAMRLVHDAAAKNLPGYKAN
ncbi:MAG: ParB-like protein [Elusimicrobiota bacterium]